MIIFLGYIYTFKNQISSYEIISKMVNYMNNQPLLIEQKNLNELYFNQNVEELNLKINSYDHDSLKSKNEINDILILIKQKNELLVKSKLNKPFYITNPENKIISSNNYMLMILKYVFSFLFYLIHFNITARRKSIYKEIPFLIFGFILSPS